MSLESRSGPTRETKVGANPVAGIEVLETVPATEDWDLYGFILTIVTAIAVADRDVDFVFKDGAGNEFLRIPFATSIPASQTVTIHLANYETKPTDTTTNHYHKLPSRVIEMGPSYTVETVTALIQAADDFGAMTLFIKKFRA